METRLHLTQTINYQIVNSVMDLFYLGKHTNDYIDGMSPVEWSILKKK